VGGAVDPCPSDHLVVETPARCLDRRQEERRRLFGFVELSEATEGILAGPGGTQAACPREGFKVTDTKDERIASKQRHIEPCSYPTALSGSVS